MAEPDKQPELLAIGGALIDRRGRCERPFAPGVSNPGAMREEVGGAAFNTARIAARFGLDVTMMTIRGGDLAGQAVATAIEAAGLRDMSVVHLDRATPNYTAILDADGEMKAALADMALYETGFARLLRRSTTRSALAAAELILLDANIPGGALSSAIRLAGAAPVYANAISPAKVVRFAPVLGRISCLFMNRGEAAALIGKLPGSDAAVVAALRKSGLKRAVVTGGAKSILLFDEADAWSLAPPKVQVADVTGCGDALAGGVIAALAMGDPLTSAIRQGAAVAALVAGVPEVSPDFSHDSLAKMLETVGEPVCLDCRQSIA